MTLLDGKALSQKILSEISSEISKLPSMPKLDIILVGDDYASQKYVNMKQKMAKDAGMNGEIHALSKNATTEEVLNVVNQLNNDNSVTGFMVQLPMPKQIDRDAVVNAINFQKDVDGLTSTNLGLIFQNKENLVPATPLGIIKLLEEYKINVEGKSVAMIGASSIVGLPMMGLLNNRGATVTVCHLKTPNTAEIAYRSDIVISATGVAKLVKENWIKEDSIVIDVGITKDPDTGEITGDVDFKNVSAKCSYITPVPGGVGPMTIASLMWNTVLAYKIQNNLN